MTTTKLIARRTEHELGYCQACSFTVLRDDDTRGRIVVNCPACGMRVLHWAPVFEQVELVEHTCAEHGLIGFTAKGTEHPAPTCTTCEATT